MKELYEIEEMVLSTNTRHFRLVLVGPYETGAALAPNDDHAVVDREAGTVETTLGTWPLDTKGIKLMSCQEAEHAEDQRFESY